MIHVTDISNLLRKLVPLQLKKAATRNAWSLTGGELGVIYTQPFTYVVFRQT